MITVIDRYGGWQAAVMGVLAGLYDAGANKFPDDVLQQVGGRGVGGGGVGG